MDWRDIFRYSRYQDGGTSYDRWLNSMNDTSYLQPIVDTSGNIPNQPIIDSGTTNDLYGLYSSFVQPFIDAYNEPSQSIKDRWLNPRDPNATGRQRNTQATRPSQPTRVNNQSVGANTNPWLDFLRQEKQQVESNTTPNKGGGSQTRTPISKLNLDIIPTELEGIQPQQIQSPDGVDSPSVNMQAGFTTQDLWRGLTGLARNDGVTPPAFALGYLGGSGSGNAFDRLAYTGDLLSQIGLNFGAGFLGARGGMGSKKSEEETTTTQDNNNPELSTTGQNMLDLMPEETINERPVLEGRDSTNYRYNALTMNLDLGQNPYPLKYQDGNPLSVNDYLTDLGNINIPSGGGCFPTLDPETGEYVDNCGDETDMEQKIKAPKTEINNKTINNKETPLSDSYYRTRYFNPFSWNSPAMNFYKAGNTIGSNYGDYSEAGGKMSENQFNTLRGVGGASGLAGGLLGTVKAGLAGRGVGRTNRYLQDRAMDYNREMMMDDYAERDRMDLFNDQYMQYYGMGFQDGGVPVSNRGMYEYPNQPVIVPSNNITMKGINHPVMAYPDKGNPTMMYPNQDYLFPNANSVYEVPVMQDGGDMTAAMASGRKITGTNQPANSEVENREFIQLPNGEIPQVEGKMHAQGGEKLNLPEGSKVLSDNIKIGAENKKIFNDLFGVNLKANETYAKVMEKLKKKAGIEKLEKEQEKYISKIEKANDTKDKTTKNINLQLLNDQIFNKEQTLNEFKGVENEIFNMLFESQEKRKESSDKNIRKRPPLEQPSSIQIPVEGGKTVEAMQDGGQIRFLNQNDMQAVVTAASKEGYDNLGDFVKKYQEGETVSRDYFYRVRTPREYFPEGYESPTGYVLEGNLPDVGIEGTVKIQPQGEDNTYGQSGSSALSLEEWANNNQWFLDKHQGIDMTKDENVKLFQNEYNEELRRRGVEAGLDDDAVKELIRQYGFGTGEGFQGVQVVDGKFGDWTSTRTLPVFKKGATPEEPPTIDEDKPKDPEDPYNPPNVETRGGVRMLNVPRRLPPDPVMLGAYNLPEYDRMSPIKVSPETALRENARTLNVAKELTSQNVGSQQGANVANIISQIGNVNNQAVTTANTQNAQFKQQADAMNMQTQQAENTARNNALKAFGLESVLALDNTRRDIRSYIDTVNEDAWKADKEARSLNIMDAMYDNFTFDNFGNIIYEDTGDKYSYAKNPIQYMALSGNDTTGNSNVPSSMNNSDLISLLNTGQITQDQFNSYTAINQILNQ